MRIGRGDQAFEFGPPFGAPVLRESEEEFLQRREAAGGFLFETSSLLRGAREERHVSEAESAVVGSVFAERKLAVELGIADAELSVLVDDAFGFFVEFVGV